MNTDSNVKKSLAKRILKWSGISFLVLIIIVMITPFLFKDKLVQLVKEEANKSLNAKVDFGDFDLTLFSSFPDFRFKIQNVSVINVEPFAGDTLAYIKQVEGVNCSGGVCRLEPAFSGVRFTLTTNF